MIVVRSNLILIIFHQILLEVLLWTKIVLHVQLLVTLSQKLLKKLLNTKKNLFGADKKNHFKSKNKNIGMSKKLASP